MLRSTIFELIFVCTNHESLKTINSPVALSIALENI